ncbi:hypothetical protein COS74_01375 [bacterium CG06_land_8_20_14_3_00_33_50]|nr:MAG: hypothetical protein COS74_01375 [bacterium CG06_land_8_20_14_3_00_33_50]
MFGVQKWKNSSKGGITVSVKIWKVVMILAILVVLSALANQFFFAWDIQYLKLNLYYELNRAAIYSFVSFVFLFLTASGHDIAVRQANDKKRIAERAKQELSDIELQF